MKKLSLETLKEGAEELVTAELLASINGGTEHCCHPGCEKHKSTFGNF